MSSQIPPDVVDLMRELIAGTSQGRIRWQASDDRGTAFVYQAETAAVSIESRDGDGQHPFIFSLLTPNGVRADSWVSFDADFVANSDLFETLYGAAKRNATGADELVRGLLSEIKRTASTG